MSISYRSSRGRCTAILGYGSWRNPSKWSNSRSRFLYFFRMATKELCGRPSKQCAELMWWNARWSKLEAAVVVLHGHGHGHGHGLFMEAGPSFLISNFASDHPNKQSVTVTVCIASLGWLLNCLHCNLNFMITYYLKDLSQPCTTVTLMITSNLFISFGFTSNYFSYHCTTRHAPPYGV
jgi:hypothetical protein